MSEEWHRTVVERWDRESEEGWIGRALPSGVPRSDVNLLSDRRVLRCLDSVTVYSLCLVSLLRTSWASAQSGRTGVFGARGGGGGGGSNHELSGETQGSG